MTKTKSGEERAPRTISARGPFLLAVSVVHDSWFQTSNAPLELDPDGSFVDDAVAKALIRSGMVVEVVRGHPPADPGTRIVAYKAV